MSKKVSTQERRFKAIRRLEGINIILEKPCCVPWSAMRGDRRVRLCDRCNLNVYNFAGMSPDEILELINAHEGRLCAQFYVRADGVVTLQACDESEQFDRLERGGLRIEQ